MLVSFVRKKAAHYNIAEMAIVFGLVAVGSVFPLLILGLCLHVIGLPSSVIVVTCLILWIGFVGWLWVAFVIVGRESPNERVSTRDLIAMQVICTIMIAIEAFFTPREDRHHLEAIGDVFEFIIIVFHVIYFTLAWAMKARVPLPTYLMFALILALVWLKTR